MCHVHAIQKHSNKTEQTWVLDLVMEWVLQSEMKQASLITKVVAKTQLNNGVAAVEYPNPLGC